MCLFFLIYFGFSAWPEDGGVKPEGRRGNGGGGRAGKDEGDTPPGAEGLERYPSRESEGERITTVTAAVAVTAIVTESAIATVTAPRTVRCLLLLLFLVVVVVVVVVDGGAHWPHSSQDRGVETLLVHGDGGANRHRAIAHLADDG